MVSDILRLEYERRKNIFIQLLASYCPGMTTCTKCKSTELEGKVCVRMISTICDVCNDVLSNRNF